MRYEVVQMLDKDKLFKMTRPLTQKFKQQVDNDLFLKEGYLFKECKKPVRTMYCTCCQKRFEIDNRYFEGLLVSEGYSDYSNMTHNTKTACPLCHKSVTVKDAGRGRSKMVEFGYIGVFQKLRNDTVLLRTFCLMRDYSRNYENVTTDYSEHYRIYFRPGEVHSFKRSNNSYWYLSTYDYFDESNKNIDFYEMSNIPKTLSFPKGFSTYFTYYSGMNNQQTGKGCTETYIYGEDVVEQSSLFKYSQFENFFYLYYASPCGIHRYLNFYCKHPVLCEKLMKEGFAETIKNVICQGYEKLNYRAKDTKKFFRVKNKTELKAVKDNQNAIHEIAKLNKFNVDITDESLVWSKANFFRYKDAHDDLKDLITKWSSKKIIEYLVNKNVNYTDYYDYISWLKKYNFDITTKTAFPRYFKQKHDELMKYDIRMTALANEKAEKEMRDNLKQNVLPFLNDNFVYSDNDFTVRPFQNKEEIIIEGQLQNICVGGERYTKPYMKGETYLFCLRKNDELDKPYCTIEVNTNGNLVQSRMKFNASPPDDVKAFIEKWQQVYKRNLKKHKFIKQREVA